MLTGLLLWLENTAVASLLRQSEIAYPLVSSLHILGLGLLVASAITMDLRLLGAIRRGELQDMAPLLSRVAATGLLLAMVSGVLLFSVQPGHYLDNSAFLLKLSLIGLALLNVAWVHCLPSWRAVASGQPATPALKIGAFLSMVLWLAVLASGRWIAFV